MFFFSKTNPPNRLKHFFLRYRFPNFHGLVIQKQVRKMHGENLIQYKTKLNFQEMLDPQQCLAKTKQQTHFFPALYNRTQYNGFKSPTFFNCGFSREQNNQR